MSQFPVDQFEWGYALSDEPVLLNGMKVLFDKSASVYPVNLEPKNGVAFNSSMAKSLRNNRDFASGLSTYSFAQAITDWNEAQQLTIDLVNIFGEISHSYPLNNLDNLVNNPYLVNQANEGNCGFAAVLMAMLCLAEQSKTTPGEKEQAKQKVLMDLLDAIYNGNEYKGMKATQSTAPNQTSIPTHKRYIVNNGEVKKRIERRLEHYDGNPGDITCYVLLIGLLIFFKDHVQDMEPNLWKEIMEFQMVFASGSLEQGLKAQNQQWQDGQVNKIKNMTFGSKLDRGYKKGDLGLTTKALLELCKLANINTTHISYKELEKLHLQDGNPINSPTSLKLKDKLTNLTYPCIVGVYTRNTWSDKFRTYNFLTHWIFMPNMNQLWTWGKCYTKNQQGEFVDVAGDKRPNDWILVEHISVAN